MSILRTFCLLKYADIILNLIFLRDQDFLLQIEYLPDLYIALDFVQSTGKFLKNFLWIIMETV